MIVPKCPHCGAEILPLDNYPPEYDDDDTLTIEFTGVCSDCERKYTYTEQYTLTCCFNIQEQKKTLKMENGKSFYY